MFAQMNHLDTQRSKAIGATGAVRSTRAGQGKDPAFSYIEIYLASSADRIRMIRKGVLAKNAKGMISDLHFDQQALLGALNLKTATVNRKAARNEALSADESERVIGIARLVGQLLAIIEESGNPEGFDAPLWLSNWLREPLPALGGLQPITLLIRWKDKPSSLQRWRRFKAGPLREPQPVADRG